MNKYERAFRNVENGNDTEKDKILVREACHMAGFIDTCVTEIKERTRRETKADIVKWLREWNDSITDVLCFSNYQREQLKAFREDILEIAKTIEERFDFTDAYIREQTEIYKEEE